MSMELHVLLSSSRLPDVRQWQISIDALGFDVKLDPSLIVENQSGFLPVTYNGRGSGFEFDVCAASEVTEFHPEIGNQAAGFDRSANFRWGGDLIEMGCALVAAAALTALSHGICFDPQAGTCVDARGAFEQAKSAIDIVET